MAEQSNDQVAEQAAEQPTTPTAADKSPETKLFSQAELDAHINERMDRAERKREADTAKARKEAEDKALADNAKWQELADKRTKELEEATKSLAELDAIKANTEAATGALTKYLDAERKGLPDHIIGLLDKLSVVDQLDWLAENKSKLLATKPATEAGQRGQSSEPAVDWVKIAQQKFGIKGA